MPARSFSASAGEFIQPSSPASAGAGIWLGGTSASKSGGALDTDAGAAVGAALSGDGAGVSVDDGLGAGVWDGGGVGEGAAVSGVGEGVGEGVAVGDGLGAGEDVGVPDAAAVLGVATSTAVGAPPASWSWDDEAQAADTVMMAIAIIPVRTVRTRVLGANMGLSDVESRALSLSRRAYISSSLSRLTVSPCDTIAFTL